MRIRFRLTRFSRRRIWRRIRTTLHEMRLSGSDCARTLYEYRRIQGKRPSGKLRLIENGSVNLGVIVGALSFILAMLVFRDAGRSGSFFLVSSVSGLRVGRKGPLAPSIEALNEAGLSYSGEGVIELPAYGTGVTASEATNILTGMRYGRVVRSGVLKSGDGRLLVRTGVSSAPPAYSCELRDGHLLSYNSPVEVSSILLSGRTGPGRVSIINDGEWLVIERLLWDGRDADSVWLLLRQLRDISMAEMLSVPREITYLSST